MPISLSETLVVLPAYNEEEALGGVLAEIRETLGDVTCLVVDDGSADRTSEVARAAGARVATLPLNLGVGGAMRVGFKYAVANGFRAVVQVDADGQHDPKSLPELVAGLDEADIVIGARFAGSGDYEVSGPRKWAMKFLSVVIGRICKTKLTDTTSGFKAIGPRALNLFARYYPAEYLGDTIEALVIAARAGCVVKQVPVSMRERAGGVPSHNPVKAAIYLARAFVALTFALVRPPVRLANIERSAA
ncbi:glycosyltransferase involved in cell wall biosynthesis [Mycetocola sp. BIGb0189]|uniref:glycosyltransferase family 2 protein n=1 Tax=Mycetocola sp. BIGb0189 TaxID=2940604 RepID=UPI002167A771|nr:glycosyltransferase family 2 protein [Mycetocola sp. BIGb0189]MCS4276771.1 glycosyltransferase involved in cell wall biosynthesis [Mycetocola sp. BIGb0189]